MDSSRPSHLIEVLQAMKHFAVYTGNTRHTYTTYILFYCYTGQTAQLILPRGLDWSQSNIRNYSKIYITIIIM